ncbi:MAG TPA: alpha/beta fold hydrolase, partial [Ilumatobacteraceae bacterium]|nr:alpha/beta fold hydrolase [Ilumatobacteraceae bacterium]
MKTIPLGDLTFAVQDEGDGPAVVLLHGFPDSHSLWAHQVGALVGAGYRVVVPDLRGFGESSKPAEVERYGVLDLVGDVLGILDSLEVQRAHVVGHDWGAVLAWAMAAFVPDRVDHLAALSVGHPSAFADAGLVQRQKSWYMLLFQFEGIAEQWLSADDFANMRAWSQHPDMDQVAVDLARPGALTAALNWYRANVHPRTWIGPPPVFPQITAPTMGVWSSGDFALDESGMTGSQRYVDGSWRYERIEGAGHWMQLEAPDQVSALLVDFLPAP